MTELPGTGDPGASDLPRTSHGHEPDDHPGDPAATGPTATHPDSGHPDATPEPDDADTTIRVVARATAPKRRAAVLTPLTGERVGLRPAAPSDEPRFRAILSDPAVARWWGDPEEQLPDLLDPPPDAGAYAIELDTITVGLVQFWQEPNPQYRHAGIDIALDPEWQGHGFGRDALATLARHLFTEREQHRLVIDPAVENTAAIEVYRSVGFKPVGVMRQYELGPDGEWHDGLLMDLLPDDLGAVQPAIQG